MPPASPFEHSVAVVIGIDRYRDGIPALRTAVNDARRLGAILGSEHGYEVISLLDEDATQARITTLLTEELPARIGAGDRVLFYFAGHGVARDGDEGPNGYLLPVTAARGDDTTFLDMPLVHDALLALPCRHMLVILDSCFSGAFRWSGTRDVDEDPGVVHQEKYERYVRDPAWQVITSAAQDQRALDQLSSGALGSRPGDGAHSPFALALFDALAGAGDLVPRGTGDGLVTATELFLYLSETLQDAAIAAGKDQTPGLWPLRKHDRGEFLFFVPGRELALPPAPPLTFENNPWRGLGAYEASDAALFFGRDAEIAALRARIEAQSLTVVLGASGSGKSSLVKAGVVPALTALGWQVTPIVRPGTSPLAALARALAPPGRTVPDATPDTIAALVAARLKANPGSRLLLVIDQFEEMITLARRPGERERTMALLARLITAHPDALRVVITLRTDFEPNFDRGGLDAQWTAGRYIVPLMTRAALRDVIEKPAAARVLYFDPSSLVENLLDEVVATPGPLPLLSFALSEMYIRYVKRQGGDRAITRADFDALGGVVGALRARAEAEHDALDEAGRTTLRRVMLRLVTADGAGIARRRATDADLAFANPDERTRAQAIVQRLVEARLLVMGKDPDGEPFVEPAHDALVRGWGRLAEWVRVENDAIFPLAQQQRMARAAQEWHRAEGTGKRGLLWSDASRSAQLAPLVRRKAPWLNVTELAFAERSVRGRRAVLAGVATGVALIVMAGVAAVIGGRAASARAEQVRIASIVRSATAMVREDPLLAAQLLGSIDSSMTRSADDATRLAMLGAALDLRRTPSVVTTFEAETGIADAAVSADGHSVATAASDSIVRVWPLNGARPPLEMPRDPEGVRTVLFSPDGRSVAAGGGGGTVTLWPALVRGTPVVLRGEPRPVTRMEFSRDGARLLVTYDGAPARVFTLDGRTSPVVLGDARGVVELAKWADADRQVVVVTGDRTAQWWPVRGRTTATRTVRLPGDSVAALEVSRDGKLVAIGSVDGAVLVYDGSTGRLRRTLPRHFGAINSLSFGVDDQLLAAASADNEVRISVVGDGTALSSLRGTSDVVQTAAFSEEGIRLILTSGTTFQARVWSGEENDPVLTLPGHTNPLVTATFLAGGTRVLTASEDGSVRLWELPRARLYHVLANDPDSASMADVTATAFSHDGRELAIGTRAGALTVARLDTTPVAWREVGTAPAALCALAFAPGDATIDALACDGGLSSWPRAGGTRSAIDPPRAGRVETAEFAPRARRGLWAGDSGAVRLWDATTASGHRVVREPNVLERRCAAISDDGAQVAACAADGSVAVGPFAGGAGGRRIVDAQRAAAVAFSHGGRLIAVGHEDGSTRIRRLDAADTGRVLRGQREPVTRLSFSDDDTRLLAVSEDGSVIAWDLASGRQLVRLRPRGVEVEAARFTPDGRRILTLGYGQDEARLWNADGTGGSVTLPGDGARMVDAVPSPDGKWVLVTTKGQTAELYPIDPESVLRPLRQMRICLSAADRVRYLTEPPRVAEQHARACRGQ